MYETATLVLAKTISGTQDTYETRDRYHAAYITLFTEYPYTTDLRENGKGGMDTWFIFPGYQYHREIITPFREAYRSVMDEIFKTKGGL